MKSKVSDIFYLGTASFRGPALGGGAGVVGALAISGLSAFAMKRVGMEMQWLQVAASGAAGGVVGNLLLRGGMVLVRRMGLGAGALDRFVIFVVAGFVLSLVLGGALIFTVAQGGAQGQTGGIGPRLFTVIGWMVGLLASSLPLAVAELGTTPSEIRLTEFRPESFDRNDLQALYALNQSEVPHVGELDFAAFEKLLTRTAQFVWVARDESQKPAGFIVVMDEGADYSSVNFQWFKARYDRFLYVDRLAVAKGSRKKGVGRSMYDRVAEQAAKMGRDFVTCEVNVKPPNPDSMAFHERLGFFAIGEQDTDAGTKRVRLMGKSVEKPASSVPDGKPSPAPGG